MGFLYVNEERAKLSINANKLVVDSKDLTRSIPIESVEGVVLFGNISITTPCITELLEKGISFIWLSKRGKFFGRLESTRHHDISKQRKQFKLGEDKNFCLNLSKRLIGAKINNQKVLLRRLVRSKNGSLECDNIIEDIKKIEGKIDSVMQIDELMGYEGLASRHYFKALSELLPEGSKYKFKGRSKRPPKDEFNSLLSFGYTLLMYEIYSALETKGLNPYAAFMHQDRRSHPALASDLMEEWRAVLVDSIVFDLVRREAFLGDEFTSNDDGGVYLAGNGVKKLITEYEKKLSTRNKYLSYIETPLSFRECIHHQVDSFSRAILEESPELYSPVIIR